MVTESAPIQDYAIMNMVKNALPFVPSPEESHQILSEYMAANSETTLHYLVLSKALSSVDEEVEEIEEEE